jgi:hypothetical protein
MNRIGFIVFPGFQILDLAAITLFDWRTGTRSATVTKSRYCPTAAGVVASSSGVGVVTGRERHWSVTNDRGRRGSGA